MSFISKDVDEIFRRISPITVHKDLYLQNNLQFLNHEIFICSLIIYILYKESSRIYIHAGVGLHFKHTIRINRKYFLTLINCLVGLIMSTVHIHLKLFKQLSCSLGSEYGHT